MEGSITASAPIKLSWACRSAHAETVGTEEASGYMLGALFLGQEIVPNMCIEELFSFLGYRPDSSPRGIRRASVMTPLAKD